MNPLQNWKRFCEDVFVWWKHSRDDENRLYIFMNSIDPFKRIQFTISFLINIVLEFLNLSLPFDNTQKTKVLKLFITPANSFPWRNIEIGPEGVALKLSRCDAIVSLKLKVKSINSI